MNALWYYAIAFLVIWIIAVIFKDRLKIEIKGPLMMRKTKKMRCFIDSVAKKYTRFWRISLTVGIPIAILFMIFVFYMLLKSLETVAQAPTVYPVIPGVDIPGSPISIPWYAIIALITVVVVHEFGHGILARVEGVGIKSIGLFLLAVLPGAFVEPNNEDIKKVKKLSKLRIYAAGSIFNFTLAGVAFVIMYILSSFFIPHVFYTEGLEIVSVVPNTPADGVLKDGMIIQNINGYNIKNRTDFVKVINKTKPGDKLTFKTDKGTFTVKTTKSPSNPNIAFIGISSRENLVVNKDVSKTYGDIMPWILFYFTSLIGWIYILNAGIGTFNLLPMKPLDGGLIFEEVLGYAISEEKAKEVSNVMSAASFVLLAINIWYSLM